MPPGKKFPKAVQPIHRIVINEITLSTATTKVNGKLDAYTYLDACETFFHEFQHALIASYRIKEGQKLSSNSDDHLRMSESFEQKVIQRNLTTGKTTEKIVKGYFFNRNLLRLDKINNKYHFNYNQQQLKDLINKGL